MVLPVWWDVLVLLQRSVRHSKDQVSDGRPVIAFLHLPTEQKTHVGK